MVDLRGVQRPGANAAHEEDIAELHLAGGRVGEIAERAVERLDAGGGAGIYHFGGGVVPQILLVGGARRVAFCVGQHFIFRMAAADARRLHCARGGKIGGSQAHAVHAR